MPRITKIQSRDIPLLAETFSQDADAFDALYVNHLQQASQTFVASQKGEDGQRKIFGYATITWKSDHTHFWRYNVAQILSIEVVSFDYIADLFTACEESAKERGFSKVGVVGTEEDIPIYEQFGFAPSDTLPDEESDTIYLVKPI